MVDNQAYSMAGFLDSIKDGQFSLNATNLQGVRQFWCGCRQLTSLKGSPKTISGDFDCRDNYLTTLKDAPSKVLGCYKVNNNRLTKLENVSRVVNDFSCSDNYLTSIEGAPTIIHGNLYCKNNPITNLHNIHLYIHRIDGNFIKTYRIQLLILLVVLLNIVFSDYLKSNVLAVLSLPRIISSLVKNIENCKRLSISICLKAIY